MVLSDKKMSKIWRHMASLGHNELMRNLFLCLDVITFQSYVYGNIYCDMLCYWLYNWKDYMLMSSYYHGCLFNILTPGQNGRHFADDIFKCIFENENEWISPKISLKFVPKVRNNNIPALVQIMAWCRPGDKPSSQPMMIKFPAHICVPRRQWVNSVPAWKGSKDFCDGL